MPNLSSQSVQSYLRIREHAELFTYIDPITHRPTESLDPPPDAKNCRHKPFTIRALTTHGQLLEGRVISVGYDHSLQLRRLKFVESGEIRKVYDMLIISINNTRFVVH